MSPLVIANSKAMRRIIRKRRQVLRPGGSLPRRRGNSVASRPYFYMRQL
jgi:hypothetical protein